MPQIIENNRKSGVSLMGNIQTKLLQPVLNALQDGVFITDANGFAIIINDAYERITGIRRDMIIGQHLSELVTAGYISKSVSLEVIRERQPVTLIQTTHNGRKIFSSGNPMFDDNGKLLYVVTNVRDVTELLKAKHAEEKLETLLCIREEYGVQEEPHEHSPGVIISPYTQACYDMAERIAKSSVKILILGETGTGKTILARYIHGLSKRSSEPFMELNCAAMPEGLLEAELFGYSGGAFTGADAKGKEGILDATNGGTLFLDEIGDLPLSLQAKLLKVVEEKKFLPIGATEFRKTNIRLITATHQDLKTCISNGTFRKDLFYRLSVAPLTLPPLRERPEEVISLLQYYMDFFNKKYDLAKVFHPETLEFLINYSWPGNIRELMNITERLLLCSSNEIIQTSDLPSEIMPTTIEYSMAVAGTLKEQVAMLERRLIETALTQHGSTRAAASSLGIDQSTLVKKRNRWKLIHPQKI